MPVKVLFRPPLPLEPLLAMALMNISLPISPVSTSVDELMVIGALRSAVPS